MISLTDYVMEEQNQSRYTVVYVYCSGRDYAEVNKYKTDYQNNEKVPNLKIGLTTSDSNSVEACMEASRNRIHHQTDSMDKIVLDCACFDYTTSKVDDAVRDILTNKIYGDLKSSMKRNKEQHIDDPNYIHQSNEVVHDGISRMQFKTAVEIYRIQTLINNNIMLNDNVDSVFKTRMESLLKVMLQDLGVSCENDTSIVKTADDKAKAREADKSLRELKELLGTRETTLYKIPRYLYVMYREEDEEFKSVDDIVKSCVKDPEYDELFRYYVKCAPEELMDKLREEKVTDAQVDKLITGFYADYKGARDKGHLKWFKNKYNL